MDLFCSSVRIFWESFLFPWIAGRFEKFRVFRIRLYADPLPVSSVYFRVLPLLPPLPVYWLRGSSSGLLSISDFLSCLLEMSSVCTQRAKIIYAARSFTPPNHLHAGKTFHAAKLFRNAAGLFRKFQTPGNLFGFSDPAQKEKAAIQAAHVKIILFIPLPDPLPVHRHLEPSNRIRLIIYLNTM